MSNEPTGVGRDDRDACFTEAARLLVSNAGAAERLLTAHRPAPNGGCVGCGHSQARWPCALVAIGRQAHELAVSRYR